MGFARTVLDPQSACLIADVVSSIRYLEVAAAGQPAGHCLVCHPATPLAWSASPPLSPLPFSPECMSLSFLPSTL